MSTVGVALYLLCWSLAQTALKAIIAKLTKAPEAEYFLYPVDSS